MPKRKTRPSVDDEAPLEQSVVDASSENEQLWALHEGILHALAPPLDVHVVGEPMSLIAVDYAGNSRRGLVARCRREDGSEHGICLADVQVAPDSAAYSCLAGYYTWLGVDAGGSQRSGGGQATVRKHKAGEDDVDLTKSVDLVVLAVKERAARCRLLGSGRAITLRAGSLHKIVPGQIATVSPNKHWRHAGHPYLSGRLVSARVDAPGLGLVPLALHRFGQWDPAEQYWGEEDEPIENWAKPIVARGPRPMFEMEQVLPGNDPEDFDSDPILAANDLRDAGDTAGAENILAKMLETDLRCLDAHAHLGNILFRLSPHWAVSHFEVGVRIGELSLGDDFDGVLAWGLIDNRPFLRCLQGYGLCLWRLQRWEEAERVFERMLWLNPADNQGVRGLLPEVQARKPWVDDED
ncbi:MAG: cytoplasmic protein [Deltaproteobacteria bacterium]